MSNYLRVLDAYTPEHIDRMKERFRLVFRQMVQQEKALCHLHKITSAMSTRKYDSMMRLITHCKTAWHVEALRRLVVMFNRIPENFKEVEEYARKLKSDAYGLDKTTNVPIISA